MRVVLADLHGLEGFVSKDTIVGGYGSRLTPFSRVTAVIAKLKRRFHDVLSIQIAYLAALADRAGHQVVFTRGELVDGDLAVVLSSLVDYRHEAAWATAMRARGVTVGFVGLAASRLPELFESAADFVVIGEPEEAIGRLFAGERLTGRVSSHEVPDLDSLPFPRWDLLEQRPPMVRLPGFSRPLRGGIPLLASRSCPEFCTYCPHRILSSYRSRSVTSIADELELLCDQFPRPYVIFRDPLFTQDRERCLALADAIQTRGLRFRFECETRLDRLDPVLIDRLHAAGMRTMSFGVESSSEVILRKVARRPIPAEHQRAVIEQCRRLGIATAAFYVIGFLHDDWESIATTIAYAAELGSTFAQFKVLTPYPGTALWKQMKHLVYETDWQKFDGYTATFTHPTLSAGELRFLLGAAFSRFYMRPTWLDGYLNIRSSRVSDYLRRLDGRVYARQARQEIALMSRAVQC
jgi:anaerobic magnesium-protoporphyrin IX monomethyl ester cyclase